MGIMESVRAVRWARKRQHRYNPVVMNVSGADPIGTIRLYGEHVLPRLRG
jgi:hypothetical protein